MTPRLQALAEQRQDSEDVDGQYYPAESGSIDNPHISDQPLRQAAVQPNVAGSNLEIKTGSAESGSSPGWYRVSFQSPYPEGENPTVMAVAQERPGDIGQGPPFDPPGQDPPGIPVFDFPDITLPDVGLPDIQLPTIDLDALDLQTIELEELNIDEIDPGERIEVGGRINLGDPLAVGISEINFSELQIGPNRDPFEDRQDLGEQLREGIRNSGQQSYDRWESNISVIPIKELRQPLLDLWNSYLVFIWGAGRDPNPPGEGVLEGAFGAIGDFIQDVIEDAIGIKADEILELGDKTNNLGEDLRQDINSKLSEDAPDGAFNILNDALVDAFNQAEQATNELRNRLDGSDGALNRLQERSVSKINEARDRISNSINSQFVTELNNSFQNVRAVVDTVSANFNSLSNYADNVDSNLNSYNEQVRTALEDLQITTSESITELRDELQATLDDVTDELEDVFDRQVGNNNLAYQDLTGLSQQAIDQAPNRIYQEIGAPEGELITPVSVRNIDRTGFEFLGYSGGTEIQWTAIGLGDGDGGGEPTMSISGPTSVQTGQSNSWTVANVPDDADSVEWEFGDGGTATGTNATHTYSQTGQYTIQSRAVSGTTTVGSDNFRVTVTTGDGGGNGGGDNGDGDSPFPIIPRPPWWPLQGEQVDVDRLQND